MCYCTPKHVDDGQDTASVQKEMVVSHYPSRFTCPRIWPMLSTAIFCPPRYPSVVLVDKTVGGHFDTWQPPTT
eukprot:8958353-Pyramimonas_sp.AAC.2